MRETRLKGNYQGGGLLYGYKIVERKIVIDDEKADQVRFIFEQYANGAIVKDIIVALNEKGLLCRGKPFARNTVYGILNNSKYSGVYVKGDEIIENMYPKIIPTETYNKVRERLAKNKYGRKSTKTVYMLRHKVVCGICGRPISAETGTARNGELIRYYKCIGRKADHNGCAMHPIRKEYLEQLVIDTTVDELSNPQIMDGIVKHILELQERQATENVTLKLLNKEKASTERALQNLLTAIENGIYSNTTNKRLHELEAQQAELEKQIIIEESKCAIRVTESMVRSYYKDILKSEPQMLINLLIKRITVYADRIEIEYNSPLRTSPDENQGFLICRKIYKIGQFKTVVILKL